MLQALDALERLTSDTASPDSVLALIDVGRYFFFKNDLERSVRVSAVAVLKAVTSGNRALEARARMSHGTGLRHDDQLFESFQEFSLALELARAAGDASLEAKVLNNLGNWYNDAGLYLDAREIFETVAKHFIATGDAVSAWMALDNAAISCIGLDDYQHGLRLATRAAEVWTNEPHSRQESHWIVQGMSVYCQLLLMAGRTDEAVYCARNALAVALQSGSERSKSLAETFSAVTEFCSGRADSGIVEGNLSRTRLSSSFEHRDALGWTIFAFELTDELDRALELQAELLAMNKESKFASLRRVFGRASPDESQGSAKLATLGTAVDRRVDTLISTAVLQGLRYGFDQARIFRVGRLSELFALSLGWEAGRVTTLKLAANLMDVGIMVVPDGLLRRPATWSRGERGIFEEHARFGAEVLERSRLSLLQPCAPIVRFHHEYWDGSGPAGLTGNEIPVESRVVALCDVFDELTHSQPWKGAVPVPVALQMIGENTGKRFDPNLSEDFAHWVRVELCNIDDLELHLSAEALDNGYCKTQERIRRLLQGADMPVTDFT